MNAEPREVDPAEDEFATYVCVRPAALADELAAGKSLLEINADAIGVVERGIVKHQDRLRELDATYIGRAIAHHRRLLRSLRRLLRALRQSREAELKWQRHSNRPQKGRRADAVS